MYIKKFSNIFHLKKNTFLRQWKTIKIGTPTIIKTCLQKINSSLISQIYKSYENVNY